MKQIVCEDCGKRYNYERDEFCPKCGAFNQPVRTWGMDAQGNVVRVDGVNERGHGGSFVHSEVHKEKRVRQAKGMDWSQKSAKRQPPRPTNQKTANRQKNDTAQKTRVLLWVIAAIVFFNFIVPLLAALMSLF